MDYLQVLARLTSAPGVTGHEARAADEAQALFGRFSHDVWRDVSGSVFCRVGQGAPVVLIAAHTDEIGMMVTDILEGGFLRFGSVAGVDPRVLPGSELLVDGRETLRAVVGALPPHLVQGYEKNYRFDELYLDVGLPQARVRELVRVGDVVRFDAAAPLALKNDRIAGKTLDDRAHVAVMARALELLKDRNLHCTAVFCATVQEEFSGLGAKTGAYQIRPDIAVAIDVTHARMPSATEFESFDFDKVVLTKGSNAHPKLFSLIEDAAKEMNVPYDAEIAIGHSGTDAWDMQVAGCGAASAILSTPVRYMHTSVETLCTKTLDNHAKVLVQLLCSLGPDWEEKLCLDA